MAGLGRLDEHPLSKTRYPGGAEAGARPENNLWTLAFELRSYAQQPRLWLIAQRRESRGCRGVVVHEHNVLEPELTTDRLSVNRPAGIRQVRDRSGDPPCQGKQGRHRFRTGVVVQGRSDCGTDIRVSGGQILG